MPAFFGVFLLISLQSFAGLTPIATDQQGKRLFLSQKKAVQYCEALGLRLPDARVFATQAVNAQRGLIKETEYPGKSANDSYVISERRWWNDQGYQSIFGRINGTPVVHFYYKHHNWPPIVNPDWVWTASEFPTPDYQRDVSFAFNDKSKIGLDLDYSENRHLVQCETP